MGDPVYCTLPYVRVGVGNDLLKLSDMLDFEGTEISRNLILNFLMHFSYDFFLHWFPQ